MSSYIPLDPKDRRRSQNILDAIRAQPDWPNPVFANGGTVNHPNDCPHVSLSGDEGPISELGRMPKRWRCDECGEVVNDE